MTLPRSLADLPPFEDYDMSRRTYRYSDAEPLYPFGFGLSYRPLRVTALKAPATTGADGLTTQVTVTNPHAQVAADVVQLYLKKDTGLRAARHELAAFARIELQPRETRTLEFKLTPRQIASVHTDGRRTFEPGHLTLWAGTGQPDARSQALGVQTLLANIAMKG